MQSRKKKKRDRIPRNTTLLLYCEREENGVQRFHELRLSADGRSVYTRWGRADKPIYRANKKSRYHSKDDALNHSHTERLEKLHGSEGWVEKAGKQGTLRHNNVHSVDGDHHRPESPCSLDDVHLPPCIASLSLLISFTFLSFPTSSAHYHHHDCHHRLSPAPLTVLVTPCPFKARATMPHDKCDE